MPEPNESLTRAHARAQLILMRLQEVEATLRAARRVNVIGLQMHIEEDIAQLRKLVEDLQLALHSGSAS